jgi:hypothetical protein
MLLWRLLAGYHVVDGIETDDFNLSSQEEQRPDLRPTRKVVFQRPPKGGSLTWARDQAIIYETKKRRRQGEIDEEAVTGAADIPMHFLYAAMQN